MSAEYRVQVRLTEDGKVLGVVVAPTAGVSALQLNLNTQNTTHSTILNTVTQPACMYMYMYMYMQLVERSV